MGCGNSDTVIDVLRTNGDEEEILAKVKNPQEYNDKVIYPDKVRINLYYLKNYSFYTSIRENL